MRKIYLLLLLLVTGGIANAQNDCATAIAIPSLPFSSGTQTTCGTVGDYNAGSYFNTSYGGTSTTAGEDFVYSITITNAPVRVNVALGGAATWKIASVHSACPPTSGNAIGGAVTSSSTTGSGVVTIPTNGTYYIFIDTWPTPNCGEFTLSLAEVPETFTSIASGNWSAAATWDAGLAPVAGSKVVVSSGHTVTIDQVVGIKSLQVDGTIAYNTTSNAVTLDSALNITNGGIYNAFNGTTGRTLNLKGDVIIDGTADFSKASTLLNFNGTVAQTISGAGSLGTGSVVRTLTINNIAGITLSRVLGISQTLTLTNGAFNVGSNLTIDNTVVGTGSASTAVGVLRSGNASLVGTPTVGGTATYNLTYNNTGSSNAAIVEGAEVPASRTINTLTINNTLGVTLNDDLNVSAASAAITFTSGILTVATGKYLKCTNASYNGTTGSATSFVNGALALTWGTSATKTYPIGSGGQLRKVVATGASGTSGLVSFTILNPSGGSIGSGITALTNSRLFFGEILSGSYNNFNQITIDYGTDDGFGAAPNADKVIGFATSIGGTYDSKGPATGTTSPLVSTSAAGTYTLGYYRFGVKAGTLPITWDGGASTSNWSDAANWSGDVLPTITDDVLLNNTTINFDINASVKSLTINSSATLNVNANTLSIDGASASGITLSGSLNIGGSGIVNLGPIGGGNRTLSTASGSNLNVTGGELNINGNMVLVSGANFTQSAGAINIDGNDGTALGSVASGTDILGIGTSATNYASGTLNLTGGTITIIDPPFAGTAPVLAFKAASSSNRNLGLNHTLILGGTSGLNTSTATLGFGIDTYVNSSILQLGNVIVNGGSTSDRIVNTNLTSGGGAINIGGNLTINAGCEMKDNSTTTLTSTIAGNIINDGIFTKSQPLALANLPGNSTTAVAVTNPQSIGGTGIFRNSATTVTGNFSSLVINNSTTVTLNTPISVSGTLTLTAGVVNTGANTLTLGVTSGTVSAGTLARTNGWVNGIFKRGVTAATSTAGIGTTYPVGTATTYHPAVIYFTGAPSTAGSLTVQHIASDPGSNGLPLSENSLNINTIAPQGYWSAVAGDGLAGGTYSADFTATGFDFGGTPAEARIVKRADASSAWTLDGSHVAAASSVVKRAGLSGFSEFGVAYENIVAPVTLSSFTGVRVDNINKLSWTTKTEVNNAGFELQRSADGRNFTKLGYVAAKSENGNSTRELNYSFNDTKPYAGVSYYRLNQVDKDGKSTLSNVVAIKGDKLNEIQFSAVYPNPAKDRLNVVLASPKAERVTLVVTDLSGKVIKQQIHNAVEGNNNIEVNVNSLSAGTYIIKLVCASGCETAVQKFMKN